MKNIRFREQLTNGDQETTLKWNRIVSKDELLTEVFTSEELFEDLSQYWKDLEKRTNCKVGMSYEWAYNWWQNIGKNRQRSLYILTFWDGTKLVGLAPFYKGFTSVGNSILETRLQLIGSGGSVNEQIGYTVDYSISKHLDVLVDQFYVDVVADRLVDLLTPDFLNVDIVKLHRADSDSFIVNHLYPELEGQIPGMLLEHTESSPFIDLSQKELLNKFIKDQKTNGHHLYQSSDTNGQAQDLVIKDVTSSWQSVEKAAENFIVSHQSDRNGLGSHNIFNDERFRKFFMDVLKEAYHDDNLWFKQAFDGEDLYDSLMVVKYDNCYNNIGDGLDGADSRLKNHIKSGLLVNLIEDAINEGVRKIESMGIEERNNYDITSDSIRNWNLTIPFKKKRFNALLFLNRISAFFYKYFA